MTRSSRFTTTTLMVLASVVGVWLVYQLGRASRAAAGTPKLNLLLITLDTTRADYLGCYGGTAAHTPNLDRLAAEGARFAQCSTCSPLTLPSHASIMTGVYPYVHRARRNGTGHLATASRTLAEVLSAAGFRTRAAVASFVLNRQFGLDQGFEVYHDVPPGESGSPLQAERRADAVCDDAIGLLPTHTDERFFLWVHFYDAHAPYRSTIHPDADSPAAYADEITFMDRHVGRLLTELSRRKLDANTLVVVVGDHGEGLGQHDESTHGYFLYDTTLRVPLIFRCPDVISAGQVVAAPVRTIDIAPTILEILTCPSMPDIEGTGLYALLRGADLPSPLPAYAETFEANVQFGLSPLRSLTCNNLKLIVAPRPELYDLSADPGETTDLAPQRPEDVAMLQRQQRSVMIASPGPVPADTVPALTTDDAKRLQALGYVGTGTISTNSLQAEPDSLEARGGNPRDSAKLFQLNTRAHAAFREGRFSEAEAMYRQLLEVMPKAPRPYAGLAESLRAQHRLDEALESLKTAVTLAPDDAPIRGVYGTFLLDAGRPEEAAAQFQIVLRRTPQDTVILHNMAIAASRQGRAADAASYLRKALAIDPNFTQAAKDLQMVEQNARR